MKTARICSATLPRASSDRVSGVADTHAALWYLYGDDRLSPTAKAAIQNAAAAKQNIAVSSITLAEIVYLVEKGRVPPSAYDDLRAALANPRHVFMEAVFSVEVTASMRLVARNEVPDMPDRIVAATAVHLGVPVISRDRRIRAANLRSVW